MGKAKDFSFIATKGSLTVQFHGKTHVIAKDDERFEKVLKLIREGKTDQVPEIVDPGIYFKKQGLDMEEGLLKIDGEPMPPELNQRITEYKSQNLPFKSLLRFWENLKQNPSFNSRQQLFKFLSNQGHSITEDGCFIGYRGVRDDFKDKHSGTFDNSPGQICKMPRQAVDDNPNNTCSHGLHVGGFSYAKSFGPKLVTVKVNPRDVVAVPNDYNGQKMRVCEFEVLDIADNIVTDTVVSEKGKKYEPKTEPTSQEKYHTQQVPALIERQKKARPKSSYANNHAKRGPNGQFIPKKKKNARRSK